MLNKTRLLHATVFLAFQFTLVSPASAQEAQPGDACPVVGRYIFSGGPELSGVTHQMVCNASNVWSSILDNDAAGNVAVAHAVSLTGDISPAQITANQNDYNPAGLAGSAVLRLSSDASRNITSLAGGADGRVVTLMNIGSFPIVLKNDDGATGTAASRFALTGDLTLAAKQSAILMYDSTASRWRQIANGTATGSGDNLGSHTATQNIVLGSYWLSGDGGNEGIQVDGSGNVGINIAPVSGTRLSIADSGGGVSDIATLTNTSVASAGTGVGIVYGGPSSIKLGGIGAMWEDGTGNNSGLYFSTRNTSYTPKMYLSAAGNLGIGTVGVPGATLDVNGSVAWSGDISPAQITSNQNNYNPTGLATASVLRLTSNASRNITSLAGGADGRIITVMNVGTNPIVLKNDDGATGTAANRFLFSADATLNANQSLTLIYDSTTQRWRSTGTLPAASAAAGGSDRQIQFNNAGALGGVPNFEFKTDGHLDSWENLTTTAGGSYAHAVFSADVAPTAAQTSGRSTRGLQGAIWVTAGNTNQVRSVTGSDGYAQNLGSGAIESMKGVQGYTYNNGNAAITSMFGNYTGVESAAGSVTNMWGAAFDTLVSGGTVGSVHGLLINNQITGGTVTHRYGIFLNIPTGSATNDWGIYQNGSQNNRFNGAVGINSTPSGSERLRVWAATGTGANFTADATTGIGLYAYGSSTTGQNFAVLGDTESTTGTGVSGNAKATTGINYGGYFSTASTTGRGVYGYASAATGANYGVFGDTKSTSGSGVYGYNEATSGSAVGVSGVTASANGYGVYGYHDATGGSGISGAGILGESGSTDGYGVYGYVGESNTSGAAVQGETPSTSGYAVYGLSTATSGAATGVAGESDSTTGKGVFGYAVATTGANYGVYGRSDSSGGYGVYCNSVRTAGCGGNRAWTNTSDARLKDHIEDLGAASGLDAIMRLRPVRYHWKDAASAKKPELGFLAQDVEKVYPELVSVGSDQEITTPDGKKQVIDHALTMSYGQMVVPLVKAVQELKAENDDLRARLEKLESETGQKAQSRHEQSRLLPATAEAEQKAQGQNRLSNPPPATEARSAPSRRSPHRPTARNSRLR